MNIYNMSYNIIYMAICGIYKIQNKINNKVYIGQSVDIEKRWTVHKRLLNQNKHHNNHLQNAWNKYTEKNFIFTIIEECSIDLLNNKEQYWIEVNDSYNNGYNLDKGGSGILGYRKGYYRVIKKGTSFNDKQIYQLVNPDSYPVITSILKDKLYEVTDLLNDEQITEAEAKSIMKKEEYAYRSTNKSIKNPIDKYDIDYLIKESSKGLTKREIIQKNKWTEHYMREFLKEKQIKWHQIYQAGEELKIKKYDKKNNIQKLLNKGNNIDDIVIEIGCSKTSMALYKKKYNIREPQKPQNYIYRSSTNTGIRYVSLLSTGKWRYHRTKQNPVSIQRNTYEDLKQVIKEKGYIWIIDDKEQLKKACKKSKKCHEIKNNKKIGKKKARKRKKEKHKQKFAKKRALVAFRRLFFIPKKEKKSSTGIKQVTFNKGDNSWNFNKPDTKGYIKRQKLSDLYKEIIKQNYDWVIEDVKLLHKVIEEVKIYQKERKKPFFERKTDFYFI